MRSSLWMGGSGGKRPRRRDGLVGGGRETGRGRLRNTISQAHPSQRLSPCPGTSPGTPAGLLSLSLAITDRILCCSSPAVDPCVTFASLARRHTVRPLNLVPCHSRPPHSLTRTPLVTLVPDTVRNGHLTRHHGIPLWHSLLVPVTNSLSPPPTPSHLHLLFIEGTLQAHSRNVVFTCKLVHP